MVTQTSHWQGLQGLFRIAKGFINLLLKLIKLLSKPAPEDRQMPIYQMLPLSVASHCWTRLFGSKHERWQWLVNVEPLARVCYLILLSLGDKLAILKLLQGVCGLLAQAISKIFKFCLKIGKVLLNCGLLYSLCVRKIKLFEKQFIKSQPQLESEGIKTKM